MYGLFSCYYVVTVLQLLYHYKWLPVIHMHSTFTHYTINVRYWQYCVSCNDRSTSGIQKILTWFWLVDQIKNFSVIGQHLCSPRIQRSPKIVQGILSRLLNHGFLMIGHISVAHWHLTRECGNYSEVSPLKAARRDSISNLTSFGASTLSCRQIQCRLI